LRLRLREIGAAVLQSKNNTAVGGERQQAKGRRLRLSQGKTYQDYLKKGGLPCMAGELP
jgi:hypothetical protein